MAMKLSVSKTLNAGELRGQFFRAKNPVVIANGVKVGEKDPGASMSAYRVNYRNDPKIGEDPVISRVGRVIDHLFGKELTLKTDGRAILFCQEGYEVPVIARMVGDKINLAMVNSDDESKENNYHLLYAAVITALTKDSEMRIIFDDMVQQVRAGHSVSPHQMASLSDSFYYGWVKANRINLGSCARFENLGMAMFDVTNSKNVDLGVDDYLREPATAPAPKKAPAKKKAAPATTLIDKAKEYRKIIGNLIDKGLFEWDAAVKDKILPVEWLEQFESNELYVDLVTLISSRLKRIAERYEKGLRGEEAIGNDQMNFLLEGKPGTGKTFVAYALAATFGLPVAATIWAPTSEEDEEEGKTKIVKGAPEFIETDALLLHQHGGIEILEEVNLAKSGVVTAVLNQKLVYPYIIKRNGYESLRRNPFNICIAAVNIGTEGTQKMNESTANRFECIPVDDPKDDDVIEMIAKSANVSKARAAFVWEAYGQVSSFIKGPGVGMPDIAESLSMRDCCKILKQIEDGFSVAKAFKTVFMGGVMLVSNNEPELMERLWSEKVSGLPTQIPA